MHVRTSLKAKYQCFAETFGTYHLIGFFTLAPGGGTRFQLHRPFIGMVGVDLTPGKALKNP